MSNLDQQHDARKKIYLSALALVTASAAINLSVAGIQQVHAASKTKTVVIGSVTSDADIWRHIAKSSVAKQAHLKIKVKEFTDGATLNLATAESKVDVNAFQSYGYFAAFNKAHPKEQLANIGLTYLEPMGIYSKKYTKLSQIPDGAKIAVAKDLADEARGLRLLQAAGLITLDKDFGDLDGLNKIKSNPHHFKFYEIDDTTGPRVIKDDSVAAVLMSNSISQSGGYNVLKDALFYEKVDADTKANINLLATAKKDANNKTFKKLVKLYHNKKIQKYIKKQYQGTKFEVKKPISYVSTAK